MKKIMLIFTLLIVLFMSGCSLVTKTAPEKARDDFGCWPPSCSFISDPQGKQLCEDWKAGKEVQWFDCSAMAAFPKCVQLCESEKKNNPAPDSRGYDQSSSYGEDGQRYDQNYTGTAPPNQQQDTGIPDSDPESG